MIGVERLIFDGSLGERLDQVDEDPRRAEHHQPDQREEPDLVGVRRDMASRTLMTPPNGNVVVIGPGS